MWLEKIYICKKALDYILKEANDNPMTETGGILIGYKSDKSGVIVYATGPGPKAIKNIFFLILDTSHIRKELKFFENTYNFGYEGSWHKHGVKRNISPSFIDKILMRKVVRSKNYDVDQALLIITNKKPTCLDDMAFFLFLMGEKDYRKIKPILARDIL